MHFMNLKDNIDLLKLPEHVAIIMDGNGRWAQQKGKSRIFGHQNAAIAVRETTETAAELGIKFLTLYTFSTENWNRPRAEVDALMQVIVKTLNNEMQTFIKNNIRLLTIGDIDGLPLRCREKLTEVVGRTACSTRMSLVLALNYSSRWEIINAVKNISINAQKGNLSIDGIDPKLFNRYLATSCIPDPELLIRTSGECRISNFLLWQIAFSELYFTPIYWPDFRKKDFYEAIIEFQKRRRISDSDFNKEN